MSDAEHRFVESPEGRRFPPSGDDDQILERLRWSPVQRLRYLLDMLDFEERAHMARPVPKDR
ncbi:MAG TPA: hypothetical protein VGC99_14865 [Candidatus Tectomicrobia bacterium]